MSKEIEVRRAAPSDFGDLADQAPSATVFITLPDHRYGNLREDVVLTIEELIELRAKVDRYLLLRALGIEP